MQHDGGKMQQSTIIEGWQGAKRRSMKHDAGNMMHDAAGCSMMKVRCDKMQKDAPRCASCCMMRIEMQHDAGEMLHDA
eukprot:gene6496-6784_t